MKVSSLVLQKLVYLSISVLSFAKLVYLSISVKLFLMKFVIITSIFVAQMSIKSHRGVLEILN